MRVALVLAALAVGLSARQSAWAEAPLTEHPVVARMTTEGFPVAEGESVKLAAPLVTPAMTAEEQRAALSELVGARRLDQYTSDSVVAPIKLSVDTVRETPSGDKVRGLDLWFVARGDLDLVHEKELLGDVLSPGGKTRAPDDEGGEGFETYVKPLDPPADDAPPVQPGELVTNVYKYRFPVIEKVVVSGLVRGDGLELDGALVESAVTPEELLESPEHPTRWREIPMRATSDEQLGAPLPFRGFVGYVHATELKFLPSAVLVECHAAFVEPEGWFRGRNLLASKLPLLVQNNVRSFRRKLSAAQAEAQPREQEAR